MATHKLNCLDLDCPIPVIKTKEALESFEEGILDVELNSYSSIENVKRFVSSQGYYFSQKRLGKAHIILSIVKGYECEIDPKESKDTNRLSKETIKAQQIAMEAKELKETKTLLSIMAAAIISAILASTCCLAPLLFLIFGVSVGSLGFLEIFAPYHQYFMYGAIIIVIALWIDWFISKKNRLQCATPLCKHYTHYLIAGTIFAIIMATYPFWAIYLIGES